VELTELLLVYEALSRELRKLDAGIKNGVHQFADGRNLTYMPLVDTWRQRIPFANILGILNDSHMKG
jgi:hypothetical protein